jgi:hypothetical protein
VAAETVAGKTADAPVTLASSPLHHPSLHPFPVLTFPFSLPRSARSGRRRRRPEGNEADGRHCSLRHGGSGRALDARPWTASARRHPAQPPTTAAPAGKISGRLCFSQCSRACADEGGRRAPVARCAWLCGLHGHVSPCTSLARLGPLLFSSLFIIFLHLDFLLGRPNTPPHVPAIFPPIPFV